MCTAVGGILFDFQRSCSLYSALAEDRILIKRAETGVFL